MITEWLRRAIATEFGANLKTKQLAQVAEDLRRAANELEVRADALQGMERRERKNPHGREPGDYIVIDREVRPGGLEIRIGKAVYRAIGCPPRLDIQRSGQYVSLRPAFGDVGYKVSGGGGRRAANPLHHRRSVARPNGRPLCCGNSRRRDCDWSKVVELFIWCSDF